MAVNINTFKNYVEAILNKNQIGGTVTPAQFNLWCNQAQLALFEKDRNVFLQTGNSTLFMDFFFKNLTTGVPPTGTLAYPSDFLETTSIRHYYVPPSTGVGIEVPVVEIENSEYGDISASQLMEPTGEFPKFSDFDIVIRLLPKNIGIIMWDYWREPVKPVWGFTIVSGRPVYNPATSTDFEWSENFINEITSIYLSYAGINLREQDLAQYAELQKQQSNVNG